MLTITDIESSILKYLYDSLEVPHSIKIFESVFYVNFMSFDKWVVIDSLSNNAGSTPRANFALHISTKNSLINAPIVLTALVDQVLELFPQYKRLDVYDGTTGVLKGEMELCASGLLPTQRHAGGGEFRTLNISVVYAGDSTPD